MRSETDILAQRKAKRGSPEKIVQNNIARSLKRLGFFVNNLTQPRATMIAVGLPDLLVWHASMGMRENGERYPIVLWIEVKAGKNKPTPDQLVWHREARAAGMNVCVAYSTDDVLDELKRLGAPLK